MAAGILQRFPDPAPLRDALGQTGSLLEPLEKVFAALGAQDAGSPLGPLLGALGGLEVQANVDVSGISTRLPQALQTISSALPSSALEYVDSIHDAYTTAQTFLTQHPLVQGLPQGKGPQDVALAVLDEAVKLFQDRLLQLTQGLIPADTLQRITAALTELDQFLSDFNAHKDQLGPFLARHLAGVAPDLLGGPLKHVQDSLAALAALEPNALATALGTPSAALATARGGVAAALAALDPDDPQAYAALAKALDAVQQTATTLFGALNPLYTQLQGLVQALPWDALAPTYQHLLEAIEFTPAATVDDIVGSAVELLTSLQAGLAQAGAVDDLKTRIDALGRSVREAALQSALGQARTAVLDFINRIRATIDAVPTGEIQKAVEQMLERVKQELDGLGIDQVASQIEAGFHALEDFATKSIKGVAVQLTDVVNGALAQVGTSLTQLLDQLTRALKTISDLVAEAEQRVKDQLDKLKGFLAKLEQVSFEPVGNAVIGEIDQIRDKLRAMDPNSLSDVEKLALKAALATLQALDLENKSIKVLKDGFAVAEGKVKSLLDELAAAVQRLEHNLGDFSPDIVLKPLSNLLGKVSGAVNQLQGHAVVAPLRDRADALNQALASLSPGSLLSPLQKPYQDFMGQVARLDPAQWLAPLKDLYAQIDRLISWLDVTPLLEELGKREQALFTSIRSGLLSALDGLSLPEPLKSFFANLRPVVEGLTGALLTDPGTELPRLAANLRDHFHVTDAFKALDPLFDKLMAMLKAAPKATLTDAANALRMGLSGALEAIDPWALRSHLIGALDRLARISPRPLLKPLEDLAAMKLAFHATASLSETDRAGDIATVSARFDAVISLVDPQQVGSAAQGLLQLHDAVFTALQRGVAAVDLSPAAAAYARIREELDRRLPDFLRRSEALAYDDILAGIAALRPSLRAAPLQKAADAFLTQLQPLADALATTLNGFFGALRDVVRLIDPRSLEDAVKSVYDAIHAKVRVLDPDALAGELRTKILDPLKAPLEAIDPAKLGARLDAAYTRARDAVTGSLTSVLDAAEKALDEQLGKVRAALQKLLDQVDGAAKDALGGLQDILHRVEQLVLVELIDRLKRIADKLKVSFDEELDRVRSAFDAMLQAIPLGGAPHPAAAGNG